jgi:hypothetical protein
LGKKTSGIIIQFALIYQSIQINIAKNKVLQAIGICSLHLINVRIKKNADSNSSLQQQQQQIMW